MASLHANDPSLDAATRRARKLLNRRALAGAAAGVVPVPGIDWLVDAALLSRLIPAINAEFGLTPELVAALPQRRREEVETAVGVVGSLAVGKYITRDLVLRASAATGRRLAVGRAARFVPFAGQALSAVIGYAAIRSLGEQHIRDCVQVCRAAAPALPAWSSAAG